MTKGKVLLLTSILLMNVLLLLPSLIFTPVEALDYGTDEDLGNVDASFWGEGAEDYSGRSVASAGDINGDGYGDILIGVSNNDGGGDYAGQTYLIFGKASGWAMDANLSASDASFIGENPYDYSGCSVAGAGDVNGDGYDDIMIGAYRNGDGGDYAGQTYLILGKASGWSMDTNLSTSDASFQGEDSHDYSGCSVAGAGDVNGDGYDDILIGAPHDDDGGNWAGQTYLIFGKASDWAMDISLSESNASFQGEDAIDRSGWSVAGVGDVNGDRYDDILIGADYNDDSGDYAAGQTYLILGKASGWAMDTNLSASDASFLGEGIKDYSGCSVAGAGDVNGDGYYDILIGANKNDDGGNDAGQTYLILGKASGWRMDTKLSFSDASFWGENAGDGSGLSLAGAGDVNGDGCDDIIIGAYGNDDGGSSAGQTYLILGKASGWRMDTSFSYSDASFWGEDRNEGSGCAVAGVGDVNGDGYDDILIGAYYNDEGGDRAGQTYLIFPDHNTPPNTITSIKAYSDPTYNHEIIYASPLDKVHIELRAQDADSTCANIALVNVTSSGRLQGFFTLRLHETGPNTGIYRGDITITDRTHERYRWINATDGGWVNIYSRTDPMKSVNLTIGPALKIAPRLDREFISEDSFFAREFEATGVVPDTWSFESNASSWLDWDDARHNISGTPDNSHVGDYWVNLSAGTSFTSDFFNFTIHVNNTEPVITTLNIVESHEGLEYVVDYNSTDDGQGMITWDLITTAHWLLLDESTGVLYGTPSENNIRTYYVKIKVDDGNGGRDYTEFDLDVVEKNDPPELIDLMIVPNELFRGETATIFVEATDPENGTEMKIPVLEARTPASDWYEIKCSYNLKGNNYTAEYATNHTTETGKYSFRVKLIDLQNLSSSWYYFNDTLSVKNNPPSINESFKNISVYSDINAIVDLVSYAVDYEDSPYEITWEVVEYSPMSLFDAYMKNSTTVEIRPVSPDRTGSGKIRFKISDKDGGENFKNLTVEIMNASERPKITIILQSPENGAIIGYDSVNLTWSAEGYEGIIIYNVYFGDSVDNMSLKNNELDTEMAEISGLIDGKTYYWKITAEARGIPTIFESEIRHFTVQFGFTPTHIIEMSFDTTSVSVKKGDSVYIGLTFWNLGNVAETVQINVLGDLKWFVNKDDLIHLEVGEEKTINIKILAGSKLELRTYELTVEAVFSGKRATGSMDVKIIEERTSDHDDKGLTNWMWYIVAIILIVAIVTILILVFHRSKEKKEESEDVDVIEAEIEGRSRSGITKDDLDMLAIVGAPPGAQPFQSRPTYTQPAQQEDYQHKPRAPKVTLRRLKVASGAKLQPKALPQSTSPRPKPTEESPEHFTPLESPPFPSLVSELFPGASKTDEASPPLKSASPEAPLPPWDAVK